MHCILFVKYIGVNVSAYSIFALTFAYLHVIHINIGSYRHCVIYGVEVWSGVLVWHVGVKFWIGMESEFDLCCSYRFL